MKTKHFLLTAGVSLAITFTFSCSSDDSPPPDVVSSSSAESSSSVSSSSISSSSVSSSSSSVNVVSNCPVSAVSENSVTCGGETYPTVVIGTQTWFAKNLNYNPGTGNSTCYDNQTSYCATYGRLYDWSTAMDLPSSCNSSICSDQVQAKHKGICPDGWHISSDADWGTLTNYVGSNAATKLKSEAGWTINNGTDEFDFSALPGGYGDSDGSFRDVGSIVVWWVPMEAGACCANILRLGSSYYTHTEDLKSSLYSVRCVKD